MVICQIYMESQFNQNAGSATSSVKGLMQLLKSPIKQLFQKRYEDKHGVIFKKDINILKKLHKQGEVFHDSPQMLDEATNIQYGTEYLQYLIDENGISVGYAKYRGVSNGIYYQKIKACAAKLKLNPNSLEALEGIFKKE